MTQQHVFVPLFNSNDHHVVRSDLTDCGDKVFDLLKLSNYSTCHRYFKLDCLKSSKFSQTFKIGQLMKFGIRLGFQSRIVYFK